MKCMWYQSIDRFIEETWDILLVDEAGNNLLMGNAIRERDGGRPNDLKVTVKDEKENIVLIGIMTKPFNLVLYEPNNCPNNEAMQLLIKELIELSIELPGVIGERNLVHRFKEEYIQLTHEKDEINLSMNLMKLTHVTRPDEAHGKGRYAKPEDLFYLPYWQVEFAKECGISVPSLEESISSIRDKIEKQQIYIWEDGCPVTVVASSRKLEKGIGVGFVYTPPMFRGNGYSKSCVAAFSSMLLTQGHEYCYLFADQKNPISNGVYNHIGYENMCVFDSILFK